MKTPTINEDYILSKRKEIGEKLKAIRESRGLTMEQLGEQLDIGKSTVSKIEAGKWNFGVDTLIAFSVALQFDINLFTKKA
jgi:transcriptional regulator with XRE-family HTH domain